MHRLFSALRFLQRVIKHFTLEQAAVRFSISFLRKEKDRHIFADLCNRQELTRISHVNVSW